MMRNLDLECAKLAEKLGGGANKEREKLLTDTPTGRVSIPPAGAGANKEREKLLTDSLGVLQERGLYAFFLFLKASKRGEPQEITRACETFLRDHNLLQDGSDDLFQGLQSLAGRLDDLLFARDLLTQALVYARYHAKARTEGANRE